MEIYLFLMHLHFVVVFDAFELVLVVIGPVLQPALFSQRVKLIVRWKVKLRRVKAYDYNFLLWRPKLIQQEAKRSQDMQIIVRCKDVYV